jgi:hypothetical protein
MERLLSLDNRIRKQFAEIRHFFSVLKFADFGGIKWIAEIKKLIWPEDRASALTRRLIG